LERIRIDDHFYSVSGRLLRIARIEEEWYKDLRDPAAVIGILSNRRIKPDIFTFWQRIPYTERQYEYFSEPESLAVLPVTSYDNWWNKQVKAATRNMIRKSQKLGVETRETIFDDDFVRGMVEIFNEVPVRQGFRFWHYGKSFETVKSEFSRFLFREDLIGAYFEGELIGFAMVANAGRYGVITQFISMLKHRDKATNNALMAKAVQTCERRGLPYLVYTTWRETSLVDFKKHSGFQEMILPRYYVPLTPKGRIAIALGLHHTVNGWKTMIPGFLKEPLKQLRIQWYSLRAMNRPKKSSAK
jgi:hypothetical protein